MITSHDWCSQRIIYVFAELHIACTRIVLYFSGFAQPSERRTSESVHFQVERGSHISATNMLPASITLAQEFLKVHGSPELAKYGNNHLE